MSTYGVAAYGDMIRDKRRIGAYVSALKRALPKDGVVCELGTGTGVVAFIALEAGARKVYALEPADAIEVAREIARKNGIGEDRLELIQAYSTDVELPEKADVLIGDMRGVLPFMPGHFAALKDARERFLKPGGVQIARADTLCCAVATAPRTWQEAIGMWDDAVGGVDMSAARHIVANQFLRHEAQPDQLLSAPGELGVIDYTAVETDRFAGEVELPVERAGTAHVVPVWFDTHLYKDIRLSNAPGEPVMAYGRIVFPLENPVDVEPGDRFRFAFRAHLVRDSSVFSWDTTVTTAGGDEKARFQQSTFHGEALSVQSLRKVASAARPTLNTTGEMYARLYSLIDGERTLEEVARVMHTAFPGELDDERDALAWITRMLDGALK